MANIRYAEKMVTFLSRFNKVQREKIIRVANSKNITEAEALRVMVEKYHE